MKFIQRREKIGWNSSPWLQYAALAFLVISLGIFIHWNAGFADPDAFYHAAMPSLLTTYGADSSFPWLPFTSLAHGFTDHHFLYHIFLLPFEHFFGPLLGITIATVVLTVGLSLVLLWFLRSLHVRGAFWYVAFLFLQSPFLFRIQLAKVPVASLLVLFVGLWCLFNRKHYGLLFTTFIYTWFYGGWPVLVIMVLVHIFVRFLHELLSHKKWRIKKYWRRTWKHDGWSVFAVLIGAGLGVVLNPYFPTNLGFFWQQIVQIAVLDSHSTIGVGGEWYPYPLELFFSDAGLLLLGLLFATALFVIRPRRYSPVVWFFMGMSYGFLVLTLYSQRYVEYFAPFVVVAMALTMQQWYLMHSNRWQRAYRYAGYVIFVGLLPIFFLSVLSVKQSFASGLEYDRLAAEAYWLKEHSEVGDIVFHSDWDHFPMLFFFNNHNHYIAGLDPRFLYFADRDLFTRYVAVVEGRAAEQLYTTISELFNARYVLIEHDRHQEFARQLENNIYFENVFKSSRYTIYRVASRE